MTKFAEIIGQATLIDRIRYAVDQGKLPHAILITGQTGSGKMPLALALASYMLCQGDKHDGQPCGQCSQCIYLREWSHPDLHFVFPVIRPAGTGSDHKMESDDFIAEWRALLKEDIYFTLEDWLPAMKAENQQAIIGVGDSQSLIRKLSMAPSQDGPRIVIVWLPERMNEECANKLLKIIEEPPTKTFFILVSEEPHKILETIRSRCQRIDLKPIGENEIAQALVDRRHIAHDAAARIAHAAMGSWTAAVKMIETDSEQEEFLELFITLMRLAYARNIHSLKAWSNTMSGFGREKQKRWLIFAQRLVRENFIYNFHQPELNYMSRDEEAFATKFARFIDEHNVIPLTEKIDAAIRDIGQNVTGKFVFFSFALDAIMLLKRD